MTTTIVTDWITEEQFFERCRRDPQLRKVDRKWSQGSSPIMLVKGGYEHKEEWEKCFWYEHPSVARCINCELGKQCDHWVSKTNTVSVAQIR